MLRIWGLRIAVVITRWEELEVGRKVVLEERSEGEVSQ